MGSGCCGGGEHTVSKNAMTKEQLIALMVRHEPVQIVNVLEPKWHSLGIITGSKKIPLSELEQRVGELHKNVPVVTYCSSYECNASSEAAKLLAQRGYQVQAYEGGIKEWTAAGLPVETAHQPAGSSCGPSCC